MFTRISRSKPSTARFHSESEGHETILLPILDPMVLGLVEHIPDAVCILSIPEGKLLGMNHRAEQLLGGCADELQGFNLAEFPEAITTRIDVSFGEKSGIAHFQLKDTLSSPLQYTLSVLPHGEASCLLLKLENPTESSAKKLSNQDANDQNLQKLIDTFEEGVVVVNDQGNICLTNSVAENMFGYSRKEAEGLGIDSLLAIKPNSESTSDLATIGHLKGLQYASQEVSGHHKNGHLMPLNFSVGDLHQGNRHWLLGVARESKVNPDSDNTLLVLSSAVEQSPSAIILTDTAGIVTYVNAAYTSFTGYQAEEVVGKQVGTIQPDKTPSEQYQRLRRTIQLGAVWVGDVEDRKKSGEFYWASEMISPIYDSSGKATHYVIVQRDTTESIRDKEALRESEERFRRVAEMVGEWLWEQDAEGCYTYSSGAVSKILGLQPEDIIGKNYLSLLTQEDRDYWQYSLSARSRAGEPFKQLVNRYLHRDGYEVYTESSGEPLFDEQGKLVKWRGIDQDITAHKQFEDILRTQERAMESASVGIVICDAKRTGFPTIYVNPTFCRITGYSRDEMMGASLRILQGPQTDTAASEIIRGALGQGVGCELVLRNYRKNGTAFWNELLISPVRDQQNVITHFVGIQNDITERLHAEEERHQLEIARQIQISLLPKKPLSLPEIELAGVCIPATLVGGDYFDYFHRGDRLDIVIADVSGHNVGAAIIMAEIRSALRAGLCVTDSARMVYSPADVLAALNELLYEDLSNAELFITMFYLSVDLHTRELRYANAGHNKILLLRNSASYCDELDADGLVLGVHSQVMFEEQSLYLDQGDKLLLYTDGVIEAQDMKGQFFGVDRLSDVFMKNSELPSADLLENIQYDLRFFSTSSEFMDDITLVTVSIR